MSNFKDRFKSETKENPSTKFIDWKSNNQNFSFYDKNIKDKENANVAINLPFKFVVLRQLQSVRGWSDALSGQIISNEVEFVSNQEISAVCYHKDIKGEKKTTTIAKGLYSEIKDAIVSAGAKYHKSIYIMLEDGSIANIKLKGASVREWGDFFNRNKKRTQEEWICVKSAKKGKKGTVTFHTPEFNLDGLMSDDDFIIAEEAYDTLNEYLDWYLAKNGKSVDVNAIEVVDKEIIDPDTDDDLEF